METMTLKPEKPSPLQIAALTLERAIEHELTHGGLLEPNNMDQRKLRRTISNRLSAQRSRRRKNQYINDMEKMVHDLEELISILTHRVKSYQEKKTLLLDQNDSLQNVLELHSKETKRSEIELERKQAEVFRLKEVEKFMIRTSRDSNLDEQQVHSSRQPYSLCLGYGLQPLQKLEVNDRFCEWRFITGSARPLRIEPSSRFKEHEMSVAAKNEDEAEIDQYFNFEDLNSCEATASD